MPTFDDYRALLVSDTEGWHAGDGTLTYNFLTSIPSYYTEIGGEYLVGQAFWISSQSSVTMSASEQALMLQAVAVWNEVANVNLVASDSATADLQFASTDFGDTGLYGFVEDFPDPDDLGGSGSGAGDIWVNNGSPDQYIPGTGPVLAHTSWNTLLHELGHALGLRHPNESPSDPETNGQYTVMSYIEHPSQSSKPLQQQAYSLTGMLWDIQALQELYGANTSTRSSDTVYFGDGGGGSSALEYQYAADGMTVQGADGSFRDVILTIWDAGGTDLIDASDLASDSQIDLRPGNYSSIGAAEDNIAVAAAVYENGAVINYIEDAWGGSGNDRLIGNDTDNALYGNAGQDRLLGRIGDDVLHGNAGNDFLRGDRGDDTLQGGSGNDRLLGRSEDDLLLGQGGTDTLDGGTGTDTLRGGFGQDRLFGRGGHDTLDGGQGSDRLAAGFGHDKLLGRRGNDTLDGGQGDDLMVGGYGADVFVFSPGQDTVQDFGVRDYLDLRGANGITSFDDLIANHAQDSAQGVLIEDTQGNQLLLQNRDLESLTESDVLF